MITGSLSLPALKTALAVFFVYGLKRFFRMKTSGNVLFKPIDGIDSFLSANRFNLWVAARPQHSSVRC